mmetsp:Transcript_54960/g.96158  ORF Transcript_54960/g.96158 Transcript_54960/m.96158 type:complete len:333 (+) Transcript_54960:5511-6509(+)
MASFLLGLHLLARHLASGDTLHLKGRTLLLRFLLLSKSNLFFSTLAFCLSMLTLVLSYESGFFSALLLFFLVLHLLTRYLSASKTLHLKSRPLLLRCFFRSQTGGFSLLALFFGLASSFFAVVLLLREADIFQMLAFLFFLGLRFFAGYLASGDALHQGGGFVLIFTILNVHCGLLHRGCHSFGPLLEERRPFSNFLLLLLGGFGLFGLHRHCGWRGVSVVIQVLMVHRFVFDRSGLRLEKRRGRRPARVRCHVLSTGQSLGTLASSCISFSFGKILGYLLVPTVVSPILRGKSVLAFMGQFLSTTLNQEVNDLRISFVSRVNKGSFAKLVR